MEITHHEKRVILCVDDEKIALDALQRQLYRHLHDDYEYEMAESGPEAIKIIKALQNEGRTVALAIVDQIMPEMKGDELLAILHNTYPDMVKIMLTGQASLESAINAINKGNVYKYISKPWKEDEFLLMIDKALQHYQMQEQKRSHKDRYRYRSEDFKKILFKKSSEEDLKSALAQGRKKVFLYQQFPADNISPISAYTALSSKGNGSCILKINHPSDDYSYSFLGFHPYLTYEVKGNKILLTKEGAQTETLEGDPLEILWKLSQTESCSSEIIPSYLGGFVGFIGHDAVRFYESFPALLPEKAEKPDICFQAYRLMLIFDHKRNIVTIGLAAEPKTENYSQYMEEIKNCYRKIANSTLPLAGVPLETKKDDFVEVDIDDSSFCTMVEKAKEEMREGNILKVILSRVFKKSFTLPPISLFRATLMLNPSPYHFLLQYKDFAIVGASPEKLISSNEGELESIPVAGTYARSGGSSDKLIEEKIMNDPKIYIEHMMPVDVVRSDLASVAIPGTVKVKKFKTLEIFSHVVHVVSYLAATLRPGRTPMDAVIASFPAGTLCGVPRRSSLALIENLETSRRGPYGGVVCLIDGQGNLDSGIIIRTAILENGEAFVRTGAGLVIDSDPQTEADETRNKSKSMINAMNMAEDNFT